MQIATYTVKREGRDSIGDGVRKLLTGLHEPCHIIAVVPQMLSYFAMAPERYEVTEVVVFVQFAKVATRQVLTLDAYLDNIPKGKGDAAGGHKP